MNKDDALAILGYGLEGQAMALYLHKHNFTNLTICDERESLEDLPEHASVKLGPNAFQGLSTFKTIFRSPGIPFTKPEFQSLHASQSQLSSMTKYFFEHCPCPIIGVSGTKGKGTTSSLIYQILKNAGRHVFLGGNIGEPPVNFLDELRSDSLVILELSSFQLEDLDKSPQISVVLNITRDHLDVHPSVSDYQRAKESLVRFQGPEDISIINGDYPGSKAFAELGEGKKVFYSRENKNEAAHLEGDDIVILGAKIASKKDVALRGQHNLENVLPAILTAKLLEVPDTVIQETLRSFQGLEHRLEFVTEKNGIKFFNDSFSTTPETSTAAVRSFHEPIYLIAGGSEKHSDYREWAEACADAPNLKMVLLMGVTAARMEDALQNAQDDRPQKRLMDIVRIQKLEDAFNFLKAHALPGEVILMSPACASFDQFQNYKERGKRFKELAVLW
ncbi:MAG: UDP-N-acetylmuramoyl-L-alanine--D-glutamate ligase [Patescibacteria group bacterium]